MKRLSDVGEDVLIEQLVSGLEQSEGVLVGPGDDCAVVDVGVSGRYQLLKTDSLVEGVHYLAETPAVKVGWKAVARVISDFAAMGGYPGELLVAIAMPPDKEVSYVRDLYRGMQQCASRYGAGICGGETSAVPEGAAAVMTISGTGWVAKDQLVCRSSGQVGDAVLVTGKLGGSIQGKHLDFLPRLNEAAWLTEHFNIHAMMDLSDGLGRDLPRLAKASGCGYRIDESSLPCNVGCDVASALGDGEDFELLLTVSAQEVPDLLVAWAEKFPDLPLTVVGELIDGTAKAADSGWQHFS